VLLPEGYPESLSGDYATYQTWDTVQALCSSITGLLCTRALLQGPPLFPCSRHSGKADRSVGVQEWEWATWAPRQERQRCSGR
jgi:hypothetical protein